MGVRRVSRPLRGVGVLGMQDAGLDTTQRIQSVCEVTAGAGVPGVAVGGIIDCRCVADGGGCQALSDICNTRIVVRR
jgi:hypothetical protein